MKKIFKKYFKSNISFYPMFDNISQAIPKLTKRIGVKNLYLKYIKYIFIKFKIYELSNSFNCYWK